jgi:hypothetical protein
VDYVLYPFLALFLTSILFIHLGQRSKASLVSLLSIVFLTAWMSAAHTLFHWFTGSEDPVVIRMADYSSHPVFDAVTNAVGIASFLIFLVSFFVASISVSATGASRPLPAFMARTTNHFPTSAVWLLAAASASLSLVVAICYRHIAATGYHEAFAVPLAVVALSSLACAVLLTAIAIRRCFI